MPSMSKPVSFGQMRRYWGIGFAMCFLLPFYAAWVAEPEGTIDPTVHVMLWIIVVASLVVLPWLGKRERRKAYRKAEFATVEEVSSFRFAPSVRRFVDADRVRDELFAHASSGYAITLKGALEPLVVAVALAAWHAPSYEWLLVCAMSLVAMLLVYPRRQDFLAEVADTYDVQLD